MKRIALLLAVLTTAVGRFGVPGFAQTTRVTVVPPAAPAVPGPSPRPAPPAPTRPVQPAPRLAQPVPGNPDGTLVATNPVIARGVLTNAQTINVTNAAATGESTNPSALVLNPQAIPRRALLNGAATPGAANNLALGGRSNITPVQLQNINRLEVELSGLAPRNGEVPRGLMELMQAAPTAATRPPAGAIGTLAATVAAVVPSLSLSPVERRQLAIDLNMALNSGNLSADQASRVVVDARNLVQTRIANNPQGAERLIGELSALVAQVQGSLAAVNPDNATATATGQGGGSQSGVGAGGSPTNVTVNPTPQ